MHVSTVVASGKEEISGSAGKVKVVANSEEEGEIVEKGEISFTTVEDKGASTDNIKKIPKKAGEDAGVVEGDKGRPVSERKAEDLEKIKSDLDGLNQTKSQMIWLLKQVITAENRRKVELAGKLASGGVSGKMMD